MNGRIALQQRVQGCLTGAAIGARLGFARCVEPERFEAIDAKAMLDAPLDTVRTYTPEPNRTWLADTVPLIDAGILAYVARDGPATPEDFAAVFRDHQGIATPAFAWDGLHTIQEVLKEGMPARLSGFGAFPNGLVCAAMLAGTLKGAGNVPQEWVALFGAEALGRIQRNADRLADLVANRKLAVLRARAAV
jgi:hypothetical protein